MYGTYCRLGVHVYATAREVIIAARRKLKRSARTGRKHRDARHAFYRAMLKEHRDARALVQAFRL